MITVEVIEIEINDRKVKHYESLGYDLPKHKGKNGKMAVKRGTKLTVKVEDLPLNSKEELPYKCDYCGKEDIKIYSSLTKSREVINKDCCVTCSPIKIKEVNLAKYGVIHAMQLEETKQKLRESNLKIRGVEYPTQDKEVRQKVIKTNIEKYGETNPMKTKKVQDKLKETIIEKYGVSYAIQNEEVRNKIKQTNLSRYGVENPQQNKEIKAKTMNTMNQNGTTPCSIQQKYINRLINAKLNYIIETSAVDMAFPEEMIYIEYDGGGHWLRITHGRMTEQQFKINEIKRSYALQSKGWREIRIVSRKDKIPNDNKIIEMIEYAKEYLNTGRHFIKFDIDNMTVETSQYKKEFDFGELRRIKESDLIINM